MQKDIVYTNLDDFLSQLKAEGIIKIVFAVTAENRPVQTADVLQVRSVAKLELVAYKKPTLYKYIVENPDFGLMRERLESEGFEINRVSRNIT